MSPYITTKRVHTEATTRQNMPRESAHALVAFNAVFLALAVLAVLGYLMLINAMVSKSYQLKGFEERLHALDEVQEKLQRELTQVRSSESLSLYVASSGLVSAETLIYPKQNAAVAKTGLSRIE